MTLAYRNGVFIPAHELTVSYADAGFVEGATITDFARTYHGELFRWDDHCDRFEHDCAALGIIIPESRAEQSRAAEHLLQVNHPDREAAAVIRFATPGPLIRMNAEIPPAQRRPTFAMHTLPLPASRYTHITQGAILQTVGVLPTAGIVPMSVKHRSRLAWFLAQQAVPPGVVAVLLTEDGIPDTALGSVLVIRDETVIRPPRGTVLESVTLNVIAELCREHGIAFTEKHVDLRLRQPTDALLLAGTGFGIAAVQQCDGQPCANSPLTERLQQAYQDTANRKR